MSRFINTTRSFLFVYLCAVLMAIGAERMFWFWTTSVRQHVEVAAFYAIATAAGLALMRRFNVTSWWSLMLIAPVVAFVVEGVITPVIYTGGPLVPIFPAWFTFWHGIFSFAGLVFGIRWLLLREATIRLSLAAIGLGAFWAVWSTTLWLPENVYDPELVEAEGGPLHVLDPSEFARYVAVMSAVLILAHWLIGFVWPRPGRSSGRVGPLGWRERVTVGVVLAGVTLWTFVVPWAAPMFGVYAWIQIKGLRWHRAGVIPGAPSVIDQLSGRVRIRALLPLTLIVPVAASGYAMLWELEPSEQLLRVLMYTTIGVQGLIGFGVGVAALLKARRAMTALNPRAQDSPRVELPV